MICNECSSSQSSSSTHRVCSELDQQQSMAEILAGLLTSAVVGIAKDKLASAIADKANLLWNFDDDLAEMKDTLEFISAALQDAERRSAKEKLVQLWLKRLKNAALDISDMLEDYQDTSKQLSAKIPRALSCLPIACKKNSLATQMKSMREELKKINKKFQDFNFTHGASITSTEQHDDVWETSSCLPDQPIIGRNAEKQEIINLLSAGTKNEETLIIAIYGLGGMGKSTLAQQIYNDVHFKKYDHRIWVYVSRDFSLKKIGSSIISLLPIEGGQQSRNTLEEINQCFGSLLHGKKVLIVLDDLWEDKDTELRKLRSMLHVGKKGSMIDVVVTTRREDIARKVCTGKAYKLQPLKDDTCWEIIKRTSKFEHKHNQGRLKQIGLDIAKKCGGMALAAQAVGYLLQSKDLSGWTEINNSDIWNEYSEADGSVLPSLKLSYERMLPQLRICFSYCAILQKGQNIAEDDLIHQWIALDFIKPSLGKEYIRQLLGMSFLQVSKLPTHFGEQMMARYTMHDLVHDLATLVMADEFIAADAVSKINNNHGQKYCRYALVTKYDQAQGTKLSCLIPSKVRALHFSDCNELDLASETFSFAKCLRILDFSGCSTIQLPASICKLKQLRYLVAPRIQNEVLPEYITDLTKLQYLNLNESSRISALPESIGKLAGCLQYLSLAYCSGISKLPSSFGDLKCLMHLNMSECAAITELPDSIGDLTNLQHLELFQCCDLKVIPESLCGLTQLQYLNLSCCYSFVRLPKAIGCLVGLQYLNLQKCAVRELPESFKGLHNLLHLVLFGSRIEKGLPESLRGLTALQHLDMSYLGLVMSLDKDDLPDAMRNLTNLKVLNLSGSLQVPPGEYRWSDLNENDGYLDFIGTLSSLECLDLSDNDLLRYLPENLGGLQRLHTLNIQGCSGLKSLPESICVATGLKSLLLDGCSQQVIDQANSLLHYSLTLPLFKVRADEVSGHSNLHLLQSINDVDELRIVSLENVRFLEEAQRLELSAKENIRNLRLSWTKNAKRHVEDRDLLGELVPPISLKLFCLCGYSSTSFPSWLIGISQHLMNLTRIVLRGLPKCSNLPPLGQLPCLERLEFDSLPSVIKIGSGFCGGKGAFPRLKEFRVNGMDGLEEWNTTYPGKDGVDELMYPVLELFCLESCPRLRFKPCPPKCNRLIIRNSNQVISSLEDVETSSHYPCHSTATTSLTIGGSQHQSLRMLHHYFPALKQLCLLEFQNLSLPEGVQQLSSLQYLQLIRCDSISALPEWLSDISTLEELEIWGCTSIKSLPSYIQQLTNLNELTILENKELRQWCESEENKAKLAHITKRIYED